MLYVVMTCLFLRKYERYDIGILLCLCPYLINLGHNSVCCIYLDIKFFFFFFYGIEIKFYDKALFDKKKS